MSQSIFQSILPPSPISVDFGETLCSLRSSICSQRVSDICKASPSRRFRQFDKQCEMLPKNTFSGGVTQIELLRLFQSSDRKWKSPDKPANSCHFACGISSVSVESLVSLVYPGFLPVYPRQAARNSKHTDPHLFVNTMANILVNVFTSIYKFRQQ